MSTYDLELCDHSIDEIPFTIECLDSHIVAFASLQGSDREYAVEFAGCRLSLASRVIDAA